MSDAGALGKELYLLWDGVVLDTNYRSFTAPEAIDVVDQSAGSDGDKTFLTGLKTGTPSATIKHKAGDTAVWGKLALGTEGTLEWAEEGTAAGKPRHYVNAIVTSRQKSMQYNDLIIVDAAWQMSGAVTDGTY